MATAHETGDDGAGPDADSKRSVTASVGVILAGGTLVGTLLPWTGQPPVVTVGAISGSTVGAALALVAVLAFLGRRHVGLDPTLAGGIAAVASVGVVLVAFYRLLGPALGDGAAPTVRVGLPIAAIAGALGASLGVADVRGLDDGQVVARLRGGTYALLLGLLGFVVSQVFGLIPSLAVGPDTDQTVRIGLLTAGFGIGLVVFTAGYLRARGFSVDYIDLDRPDLRAGAYVVGGLVVLFVVAAAVNAVFMELGLPTTESGIEERAQGLDNPQFLLVLVPLSFLAIGPGEELVFRNVVQKSLYGSFGGRAAIVVASVIFASVHVGQYYDPNPVAMLSTLFIVFVLSLILGYSYYKTENILVPIAIHGTFNAIQFVLLYVELTSGLPTWIAIV